MEVYLVLKRLHIVSATIPFRRRTPQRVSPLMLYVFAVACWPTVVSIQIRMRDSPSTRSSLARRCRQSTGGSTVAGSCSDRSPFLRSSAFPT